MSLNWKEINFVLDELQLPGSQIQKINQSAYDVLALHLYSPEGAKTLLIALSPGACRIHQTFRAVPKNEKPLRFAEFLKSRLINGRIEDAVQLGNDRIVKLVVRRAEERLYLYIRLWSNAANIIVTDEQGSILDAMRRSPKRGEISGGTYKPEISQEPPKKVYEVRSHEGYKCLNEMLDAWYAEHGGTLSLETLREQVQKAYRSRINRLGASLDQIKQKIGEFEEAEKLKEYADILMANSFSIHKDDTWFEGDNFYTGQRIRIKLDPHKSAVENSEVYYERYRKAKNGMAELKTELTNGEEQLEKLENEMQILLSEENPLRLHKALRIQNRTVKPDIKKRPGISFRRNDWLLIVGRDASENDSLLRRHIKGNDLWLHARDFPGAYVFIKARAGKSVPLDILLDAANLAIFYSKARNSGTADLFYTQAKYLRRAKNGPKGLVIPTQEKNLHVSLDQQRLKELEECRIP